MKNNDEILKPCPMCGGRVMAKLKRQKFDRTLCETCWYFWTGAGAVPTCHKQGKKIYDGECIEYERMDEPPSEYDQTVEDWERYQREWN